MRKTDRKTKKRTGLVMALLLILLLADVSAVSVHAAVKYTGTYKKVYKVSGKVMVQPTYAVTINKVKKGKIRFQISRCGINASPLYDSNIITAKVKKKKTVFKWKDSWGNAGKGTMKLYKGYIKLKMVQTKTAKWNRSSLDTGGKFIKIKKKNNQKKVYNIY